jgi:hypothetical protein
VVIKNNFTENNDKYFNKNFHKSNNTIDTIDNSKITELCMQDVHCRYKIIYLLLLSLQV